MCRIDPWQDIWMSGLSARGEWLDDDWTRAGERRSGLIALGFSLCETSGLECCLQMCRCEATIPQLADEVREGLFGDICCPCSYFDLYIFKICLQAALSGPKTPTSNG